MAMALQCDICGGTLQMDAGGKTATCINCGMTHSLERVREKVQEIKGSVKIEGTVSARQTGTSEDIEQWRVLLDKYMSAGDFKHANDIVGKILEAAPADAQANAAYDELQVLKDMTIKNGVLERYNGKAPEVVIPSCVHTIEKEAFQGCTYLEKVTISNSVRRITDGNGFRHYQGPSVWDGTFARCDNLHTVELGTGITDIGAFAFVDCPALVNISLPHNVMSIGEGAFMRCTALRKINIPDGVTRIEKDTFYGCESLTSVSIPNNVTSIGYMAFKDCKLLTRVSIPNSVTSIGSCAFMGCESLTEIVLPDGIKTIESDTFSECRSLERVTLPKNLTCIEGKYEKYDGDITDSAAFGHCSSLKTITIPDSIESIPNNPFYDSGLQEVNISDSALKRVLSSNSSSYYPLFEGTPIEKDYRFLVRCRRLMGICQHCGAEFEDAIFGLRCSNKECRKRKDY